MGDRVLEPRKEEGEAPQGCRLRCSEPFVCEDGYRWIRVFCEEHGQTWREGPLNRGIGTPSCTTRALGMTLAGYQVFRSRKELEQWLSADEEESSDDFDGFEDDE